MWPESLSQKAGFSVYYASPFATTDNWKTWTKPPGCSFVMFFMQASGGGGGKGNASVATAPGGGGGGGWSRLLIPAFFLPDLIYIRAGNGGSGAQALNTAGNAGTTSYISLTPTISNLGMIILSQNGGSGGAAVTTGGAGGIAAVLAAGFLQNAGVFQTVAGQIGGAGGATTPVAVTTATGTGFTITTGGAGGTGSTGAGGGITGSGPWPSISGGAAATSGSNGVNFNMPIDQLFSRGFYGAQGLVFSGGTGGGGGSATGTGGNGGIGSYGGGGGGGGTPTGAGTPGNGGQGGGGFVIVQWW